MSVIIDNVCSVEESMQCAFCNQTKNQSFIIGLLGEPRLQPNILLPITTIYVLMFLTGVLGNLAVCIVIIRNRSMHTATNYYLFSLAIADLLILILGLPFELVGFWFRYPYLFGPAFCKIRSYVSEWSSYASVLTIVAFSTERYLAICHPLYVLPYEDLPRTLRANSISWTLAGVAALPFAFLTSIYYVDYSATAPYIWTENSTCPKIVESSGCSLVDTRGIPLYELSMFLFFLVPVGILLFLYISMGVVLHRAVVPGTNSSGSIHIASSTSRRDSHSQQRKQIIRMLAIVVVSFFLCWAPFHAQRLGYIYFADSTAFKDVFEDISDELMFISGIAYYLSSTINPILYNLMSAKYREAFRNTFCGPCVKPDASAFESRNSRSAAHYAAATNSTHISATTRFKNKDYGENMRKISNANLHLANGDESTNLYSTSDSLLLHNKSKNTKKIAFQMDVSAAKNGVLESEHVTKIEAISTDDSQRKALIVNSEECSSSISKRVMLNSSGDAISLPKKEQNDDVNDTKMTEWNRNAIELKNIPFNQDGSLINNDQQKQIPSLSFANDAQDTLSHDNITGNEPDIKSNQIKDQYNIIESKESRKDEARKNSIQEVKQSHDTLHNGNRKKSKFKMASVSIESLIESEDVSYIDEDICKEMVKPIKENEGHQTENEDESFKECSKEDNMTKLDDEVDKFHEVVIKNQTSVTNFLEVGKGSSGDSMNLFQNDLHPLIVPSKRKKHLSSSTKHIPKTHCKETKEDRRKSLEPTIS